MSNVLMALWSHWEFLPIGLIQAQQTRELDPATASQAHRKKVSLGTEAPPQAKF